MTPTPPLPYRSLRSYLAEIFPGSVRKLTLDAGFTCPNRDGRVGVGGCIYCNPRGSGTGAWVRGLSITEQVRAGIARLEHRHKAQRFIAYFQSFSNTYAPLEVLAARYREALAFPPVVGLSIGTRPDCLAPGVLDLLQDITATHRVWLELGLQSAHDDTLRRINRGHDVACFADAVARAAGRGLHLVAHVILGLPGETQAHMLATAEFLAALPVDGVKLHLLYVVRGTPLERLYAAGAYRPLERDAFVSLVAEFLERLPPKIVIHRLTGDPHRGESVAPDWCLDKNRILRDIQKFMAAHRTFQGRLWGAARNSLSPEGNYPNP